MKAIEAVLLRALQREVGAEFDQASRAIANFRELEVALSTIADLRLAPYKRGSARGLKFYPAMAVIFKSIGRVAPMPPEDLRVGQSSK